MARETVISGKVAIYLLVGAIVKGAAVTLNPSIFCNYGKATIIATPTPGITWIHTAGSTTPLTPITANSFSMTLGGKSFNATLIAPGKLRWSDGDVWSCVATTAAPTVAPTPAATPPPNPCAIAVSMTTPKKGNVDVTTQTPVPTQTPRIIVLKSPPTIKEVNKTVCDGKYGDDPWFSGNACWLNFPGWVILSSIVGALMLLLCLFLLCCKKKRKPQFFKLTTEQVSEPIYETLDNDSRIFKEVEEGGYELHCCGKHPQKK